MNMYSIYMNLKKVNEVIAYLKHFKRLSTTKVAGMCGMDYPRAKKLLYQMLNEKLVLRETETNAVYWKLPDQENE